MAVSDYTADTLETVAVEDIDSTLSFATALTVTDDVATVTTAQAAIVEAATVVGETFSLTESLTSIRRVRDNNITRSCDFSKLAVKKYYFETFITFCYAVACWS